MFITESEQATRNTAMIAVIIAVIALAVVIALCIFALPQHTVTVEVTRVVTAVATPESGNALINALSGH